MKFKKLVLVISTGTAMAANAYALDGKVVDRSGEAITSALIQLIGSRDWLEVDDSGSFTFDDTHVEEIHITAPGYSHKVIHLDHVNKEETLVISLTRSAIEQIDVTGIPIHASVIESVQPMSVLSGDALRNSQAATLGDSLANEVGVHTNFHGNVASTPIIRGLSGPRVQITQNGLDVSDASRVGPDHAVSSEVSTAEQIEVLRGPATLFFGSGAIGGVVNIVDRRVPDNSDTYGEWYISHETVNSQNLGSINLNTGLDKIAFHMDGFWRDSKDYEVPVSPEQNHEDTHTGKRRVHNTAEKSQGFTFGSSYRLSTGYVGVSLGRLDRRYHIPGHSHGESAPEAVYADLEQDRFQLISELDVDHLGFSNINTRVGYTDYTHTEMENGVPGTVFANRTVELKLDLLHSPMREWKGGVVLHYKHNETSAVGEEAFTPPSDAEVLALAIVEERHFGEVLLQLGARVERVTITADSVHLPDLEVHGHDVDAHEEESHEEPAGAHSVASDLEYTPLSVSTGFVWDFKPGYNLALSYTHAERAPSASEMFSFGPHVATGSYEVGAFFSLHEEGDEVLFELNEKSPDLEASDNIDLTFRKHEGNLGIILNAFANKVDNYYYQSATGIYAENGGHHEEVHEEGEENLHTGELPIYLFRSADAELYGFEAQGMWQITPGFKTTLFSDYVHAELEDDGAYLPRTPPLRFGARLDYQRNNISTYLNWTHYANQGKVAALEETTEGYDWLDASISWRLRTGLSELVIFVKGENLTDTEARVHTSFLKDIAPKPGRNFALGVRGSF